ncbi:E3 ubiquitin-protein ligase TRIM4-like [Crassostrea angulata]|uniref:E3 ubiquitin-protein ligase TRIM4-like n=1 Tax=Magallana angulata TaxID=2784310 RepID=UPI0022B15E33|nr:E3 ubiquitin-protein ligase TRIM4-like [Crassostrea angulata]
MAFADSKSRFGDNLGNMFLCSVCCEKFKSPRILPCGHSFCHSCIASAVNSSCEHKEAPVGFNCPLCRDFIPCFGDQKEWVNHFFLNKTLTHVIDISEKNLCGACEIENEETQGVNYCFECCEAMCETCTKFHKKSAASRRHTVCPFSSALDACMQQNMNNLCVKHQERLVELVCNDHDEPCCLLCAATQHRTCHSVEPIDVAAKKIRESSVIQDIVSKLKAYEQKLSKVKFSEEKNIDEIDKESERLGEEAEKLEEDIVRYVSELKNTFLNKLAKMTKASKEKINKSTTSLNDQIQCIKKCQHSLSNIVETSDVANQVVEVCKAKQIVGQLKSFRTKEVHISLAAQEVPGFKENKKKTLLFPKLQQFEVTNDIVLEIDIRTAMLKKGVSFSVSGKQIYNGSFLHDGTMMFPQYIKSGQCFLFKKNGTQIKQIEFGQHPLCVRNDGEEIFITRGREMKISAICSKTFQHIRSFSTTKKCFGLDVFNNHLYIACIDSIEVVDKSGTLIQSHAVEKSVECVIVTRQGNIVYSACDKDKVTSMDNTGNTLWTYTSPNLRFPYGLEKDSKDNIYIAGKDSNNIHVVSRDGDPLKVFDNIEKPWFIMIPPDDDSVCCICSDNTKMTVYRIT